MHFEFDITRQICLPGHDEPYQLRLGLRFEPLTFYFFQKRSQSAWSDAFDSIELFHEYIKSSTGYKKVSEIKARKMYLYFEQC